jgi:hypothetical protein
MFALKTNMRALFIIFVFSPPCLAVAQSTPVWTNCVSAKKYIHMDDKGFKTVNSPMRFCWNTGAFGYWRDGHKTILLVDHYDKGVSLIKPPFVQEEFSAKEFESDPMPSYIVTILYSNPAKISINYTRFGGYAYSFTTTELAAITEVTKK